MEIVCKNYLDLEGRCFLDNGICLFPCGEDRCRRCIYTPEDAYEPSNQTELKKIDRTELPKMLGLEEEDVIWTRAIDPEDVEKAVHPEEFVANAKDQGICVLYSNGYLVRPFDLHYLANIYIGGKPYYYILMKGTKKEM